MAIRSKSDDSGAALHRALEELAASAKRCAQAAAMAVGFHVGRIVSLV